MLVDFHTHIFPPWFLERLDEYRRDLTVRTLFSNSKARTATAEDLIRCMDKDGVDVAVVMGAGWCDHELAMRVNDYILEAAARYPQRLVGFCSVNPAWGEPALVEAERCARAGARGIGELHPDTQGFNLGDAEALAPMVGLAERYNLVLLTHSSEPVGHVYAGKGGTTPGVLYRFIENFPQAHIVCAHWGGGLPFYSMMPEVAKSLANVYFDTAISPFLYNPRVYTIVESMVEAEKILMGSDYPLISPGRIIREIKASAISEEAKARILGDNACSLLGLT